MYYGREKTTDATKNGQTAQIHILNASFPPKMGH